ncbi:lysophospholipid acyltransferase family protein [soil metagenome]
MTTDVNLDTLMNPPARVRTLRRFVETVADAVNPLVDLYRPYVDGLSRLPEDGRFLLVGNHTQSSPEAMLIPYLVRRAIGIRVRPLADRAMGQMGGLGGDLFAAAGAVIGAPETAGELMRHNEPILVFPGGGGEIPKFKGEEYRLRWGNRAGFARIAVENNYPIVPVGLVGGDDLYRSLVTRDSAWGRLTNTVATKVAGRSDIAFPLIHGIGPTLIPRPQRMYLRFGTPIDTTKPARTSNDKWVTTIRDNTHDALTTILADLLEIRAADPYRALNPLAWRDAVQPEPV